MARGKYSQHQIDLALTQIILEGDNIKRAHEALKSGGLTIPPTTLSKWPKIHAGRYHELAIEVAPQIAERIAGEAESLAIKYATVERKALDLLEGNLESMKPSELATAVKSVAIGKAIQLDKISSPLRGRPTNIQEVRNPQAAIRELAQALNLEHVLDADHEDITQQHSLPAADSEPRTDR